MAELHTASIDLVETANSSQPEKDIFSNNLEAQWLLRAQKKMEATLSANVDIDAELERHVARFQLTRDNEQLVSQAMGIVALVGLKYVRAGILEAREVLEAAPTIIMDLAADTDESSEIFSVRLAEAAEQYCAALADGKDILAAAKNGDGPLRPGARSEKSQATDRLAMRAKAGDQHATHKLMEACAPIVWRIIRTTNYYLPSGDNDDLYQAAMMSVARTIPAYDTARSSFLGLAELAALRGIITAVKTATRNKHAALNYADSLDQPLAIAGQAEISATLGETIEDPKGRIVDLIVARESLLDLDALLAVDFSELEYICLTMAAKGYSYEEISEFADISRKTVDNALQRAKGKVKLSGIFSP